MSKSGSEVDRERLRVVTGGAVLRRATSSSDQAGKDAVSCIRSALMIRPFVQS